VPLPLTGERTVPGPTSENYWLRRHQVAYRAAARLCGGRRVLDAGAGEGYGAAAIRTAGARTTVALDYDAAATAHAHAAYGLPTVRANLVELPFADAVFDIVVGLQVVEHVWDQQRFVAECARVLTPTGRLVVSTPNRLTFPPGNPFHSRELDAAELASLIASAGLRVATLLGVRHGTRLARHGDIVGDQLAVEPQDWPAGLAALVASVSADDFDLSPDDLDTCLDLYVVASRT
jgi:SAM-dependent methyltransferase